MATSEPSRNDRSPQTHKPLDADSPPLSRRSFLKLAGAALSTAALAGCVQQPPSSNPRTGEKVQLVYQDWRTDWFPGMVQEMLDQFHATHPNIRVFYNRDPENVEETMLADMEAGTAPDVFQGCCSWFPVLAQKGYTVDLRPYVAADLDRSTVEDWDLAQYQSFFTADGKQYGLPKYHGALALYYNKDLLDRYGVDYPDSSWDHDDYLTAMKKLAHDRDGDGQIDLWGSMIDVSWDRIQTHVNGWGGNFVDPKDSKRCLMGEPEAMAALEWLRARMWQDRVMPALDMQKTGTQKAFIDGQVAMVEDGSWALKEILAKSQFRMGIAPFPAGPVRRVTLATTDGFGIYGGTRHTEAAWELVKFLISKEYGLAMARANFLQPARASLLDQWVGFVRQQFPDRTKDVDIAAFADGHIKGYSVVAEVFANMGDARRIAYDAWDKILTLGQAPTSSMIEASRQIQEAQKVAQSGVGPCC
jgi:multiple sugar transport system substrate-binding protein